MEWYNKNIEEPVRNIVKLLRENGVNTTCSCGHELFIEGNFTIDGEFQRIHNLLYNYFHKNNLDITYKIEFFMEVVTGIIIQNTFEIKFKNNL
jgi:hypothetical protein